MGAHLAAGTLNQAALARDHAGAAAAAWLVSAAVFVVWMLLDVVDDALTRAEVGYLGAASLLCAAPGRRVPIPADAARHPRRPPERPARQVDARE